MVLTFYLPQIIIDFERWVISTATRVGLTVSIMAPILVNPVYVDDFNVFGLFLQQPGLG